MRLPVQRVLAIIVIASGTLLFDASARAQARWVKLAPFPDPCPELAGAAANGKVYLFGGLLNTDVKGLVFEYDPAADKWTKKKNMPLPAHHIAFTEYRGKIYLFGGGAPVEPGGGIWVPLGNSWEYDPASDSWKALAPMPTARGSALAAAVGNKIYVIGGASVHPGAKLVSLSAAVPHRSLATNEVYDPATNKWETRSPMPTARNHAAIGMVNGKIYILGGRVGSVFVNASATDVVEQYDPATDSWGIARARMPTARSGTAYGTYGGKIYVAGGEYLNSTVVGAFRDLEAYDPARNEWTMLPAMSIPRNGPAGVVLGHRLYIVSGQMQSGSIGGTSLASPSTDAFELTDK
jgi:N-acetylneuraminic acid mutarotase